MAELIKYYTSIHQSFDIDEHKNEFLVKAFGMIDGRKMVSFFWLPMGLFQQTDDLHRIISNIVAKLTVADMEDVVNINTVMAKYPNFFKVPKEWL
jgi:hypothetical protein